MVCLAGILALETAWMGSPALAAQVSAVERYQQIISSQGNVSSSLGGASERYQATSGVRISTGTAETNTGTNTSGFNESAGPGGNVGKTPTSATNKTNQAAGPGQPVETKQEKQVVTEDSAVTGPKVKTVSLVETWHEDFGIYELSMENTYYVYATIANGGVTDEPVLVEIPADIQYVMKFNGNEIPWTSGQIVEERGSYVVEMTAVADDSLPVSEQTIYKTNLRFRIQEMLKKEEPSQQEIQTGIVDIYDVPASTGMGQSIPIYGDLSVVPSEVETEPDLTEEVETEVDLSEMEVVETEPEKSMDEQTIEDGIEEAIGDGYSAESLEGFNPETGMASSYEASSGYYRHELITGAIFYTNVPNGMVTNYAVSVLNGAEDIKFTVLRDGEEVEYAPDVPFDVPGSYLVFPSQETSIYLASYARRREPVFQFRIVSGAVNDLGVFNAPESAVLTRVLFEENEVEKGDGFTDTWCVLEEEGTYTVEMDTEAGPASVIFRRDTTAPRFSCTASKNSVMIQYMTKDVSESRVFRDGTLVQSGSIVSTVNGNGDFVIQVYDAAGNCNQVQLNVPYSINTAAILAIILLVLFVIVGIVFVRRMKEQIKVM